MFWRPLGLEPVTARRPWGLGNGVGLHEVGCKVIAEEKAWQHCRLLTTDIVSSLKITAVATSTARAPQSEWTQQLQSGVDLRGPAHGPQVNTAGHSSPAQAPSYKQEIWGPEVKPLVCYHCLGANNCVLFKIPPQTRKKVIKHSTCDFDLVLKCSRVLIYPINCA